jgi:hypothetical protein
VKNVLWPALATMVAMAGIPVVLPAGRRRVVDRPDRRLRRHALREQRQRQDLFDRHLDGPRALPARGDPGTGAGEPRVVGDVLGQRPGDRGRPARVRDLARRDDRQAATSRRALDRSPTRTRGTGGIVVETPTVDYAQNSLSVTSEDGPGHDQKSLWILDTRGPTTPGGPSADCRGVLKN